MTFSINEHGKIENDVDPQKSLHDEINNNETGPDELAEKEIPRNDFIDISTDIKDILASIKDFYTALQYIENKYGSMLDLKGATSKGRTLREYFNLTI